MYESDNVVILPSYSDNEGGIQCGNVFESFIPENETKKINDDILVIEKQRRQRENC